MKLLAATPRRSGLPYEFRRHKSNRQTSIDPASGQECNLFNPRQDAWGEHFIWSANGTEIIGLTPTGRATIAQLQLNRPRVVNIRLADAVIGRHPPADDPRMFD